MALPLLACGAPPSDGRSITVWTTDDLPDRIAATEAIAAGFTAATGIGVEVVAVGEDQFNQVLVSSAAAGDLPDVIGAVSLAQVQTLAANDLVDPAAHAAVLDALGRDTWSPRAVELTTAAGAQAAVPSEAWGQLLYYRTDLFAAAGLPPPRTYADIAAAAAALDAPGLAGFVGATAAGDAFTQQTFEQIALGNGCQLVDAAGEIAIDSPACVSALRFYGDLVRDHSPPGAQDVDTTRAAYFAGQAAMFIWSTFVLDEMAGLRDDARPTCPQCRDDPLFLARNTGVVPAILGPDSDRPAQYGEITSWAVTAGSATDPATRFVQYMLSDGYRDWLAIAPEGKVPVRLGTAGEPTAFVDAWEQLPAGVDTKRPLAEVYPPEVLDAVRAGAEDVQRWGVSQGRGELVGASLGELPVPEAVSEVTGGGVDPADAAQRAAESLQAIEESLR